MFETRSVIGCFAMCKSMDGPRIENSDKNLLSAMAHKVAKVIQNSYDPVTGLAKQSKFWLQLEQSLTSLGAQDTHSLLHFNIKAATGCTGSRNRYRLSPG